MKKPEWLKPPSPLPFKVVNQPLEKSTNQIFSQLSEKSKEQNGFISVVMGLLNVSFQTYKAIRKLVAKDPKYPLQASILSRTLMDAFFNIVMITEKPIEYSRWYEISGYRNMWEDYDRQMKENENDPESKLHLIESKKYLDELAEIFSLSHDEKENPKKSIDYWPIPSRILRGKFVSDEKKIFLKVVYNWRYGQTSDWSHSAWGGVSLGMFANMPETHWFPGKFESDAVYTGILFLLMVLSEIEASCNLGYEQDLRYIWTILNSYYDEAKGYYQMRYGLLLKKG